jgi:hypothetical protein
MYSLIALLLVAALSVLGSSPRYSPQGKPVKSEPIFTEFKAPPDSLADMIAEAELVLRGRVVDEISRDRGNALTRTAYRVKVLDVLRISPDREPADTIEVVRSGGVRDRGSYVEHSHQVGFPAFENGREYLLFLVWNKALNSWVPAYGPDGAFDLTSGVADTAGNSKVALTLKGKKAADVLDIVRRGR